MNKIKKISKLASATIAVLFTQALQAQTLEQAVITTLKNNPEIQASINSRLGVNLEKRQAEAGYYPTVDLTASVGNERSNNPTTRSNNDGTVSLSRTDARIRLRQLLFDGFGTTSEVERQTARVNSSAYTVYSTSENTGLRAVQVYIEVLRRQNLVALAAENLKAHENTMEQISLRNKSGIGRESDLQQTIGRLALARANLIAETSNLEDAETNFIRVIGQTPINLSLPVVEFNAPDNLDVAINQAFASHPTLKSALADVSAAKAQKRAAKSPLYPRFDIELSATANDNVDGVRGTNRDSFAGVVLNYNLYRGGQDSARINETIHLVNQSIDIRNNTHRQVEESMRLSWNAYRTASEQIGFFSTQVNASVKARDAYRKQFKIGQRTLLDLLDSENEVFVAKSSLTNSKFDQLFANYRIQNSKGALLRSINVALPAAADIPANN